MIVVGYRLLKNKLSAKEVSSESHQLVKLLAAKTFDCEASQVCLQKRSSGAPYLIVDGRQVNCSISHKDNMVAAVVSSHEAVGIDIEDTCTRKSYQRIKQHYANGFLAGMKTDNTGFFERWTLAEAYAKAHDVSLLEVLASPCRLNSRQYAHFAKGTYVGCIYASSELQDTLPILNI